MRKQGGGTTQLRISRGTGLVPSLNESRRIHLFSTTPLVYVRWTQEEERPSKARDFGPPL